MMVPFISSLSQRARPAVLSQSFPILLRSLTTVNTKEVNLQNVKRSFQNKHGLFDKVDLLINLHKSQDACAKIRIGLIGAKPSLLNALLADPFATQQAWFEEFKLRNKPQELSDSSMESRVVRYSEEFSIGNHVWNLPTPFLRKGLEFVEIDNGELAAQDGCHFYFSFNDSQLNESVRNWPVYSWKDTNSVNLSQVQSNEVVKFPKLTINEINSELGEYSLELLRQSPQNSTIYTKLYPHSNLQDFSNQIDQLVTNKASISKKLYQCIKDNISSQLEQSSLTLSELEQKDKRIIKYINDWNQLTHSEFQHVFKPFVNEYERKNMSWWQLYYRADDIQQLIKQMFDTQLLNNSLRDYNYVRGQIDSFTSFPTNKELTGVDHFKFNKDLASLPTSNSLSVIKDDLIESSSSQLQSEALKLLLFNFIGLQFPVVLVSIFGHTLYDFSAYSMIGLASLGLVAGFNNVSKKWVQLIESWKEEVFEKVRLAISEENEALVSQWEKRFDQEKAAVQKREEIINLLQDDIDNHQ